MKANVLKSFYDVATQRTYPKEAICEIEDEERAKKLANDGFIELVKTAPKKSSKKEA